MDRYMTIETRLEKAGLTLPEAPPPKGNYVAAVQTGALVFVSGSICMRDGVMTHTGKVGREQTVESAYEAARICLLNSLAVLQGHLGNLERIRRVVSLAGFVNALEDFAESPKVINGASDLLVELLGEAGRHSRTAVAVSGLPLNSTVELQLVVEVSAEEGQ